MRELLSYKTAASIKEMYGCNTQYNLQKKMRLCCDSLSLLDFKVGYFPKSSI